MREIFEYDDIFKSTILECPFLHFLCAYGSNIDEILSKKYINSYINYIDYEYETPLMKAVEFKNYEITKKLIEYGAELSIETKYGTTALSIACSNGDYESTLILLDAGVDPNNNSLMAEIPIICACKTGNIKVVELLLDKNADPNMIDIDGNTAFHVAMKNEKYDILNLLLSYHALIDDSE